VHALVENPVLIGVIGGLLTTLALVVFLARRSLGSLVALAGAILLTLLGLVVERLVVTEREQVERAVAEVLAAVEANDLPGVLAAIDPAAAKVRGDASALMPLIKVEKARALSAVDVDFTSTRQPPMALSRFRCFLQGIHTRSGMQVGYFNQQVDIHWVKRGDRWLIEDYTAYYDNQPIDAVGSAAGNRPVPGR
jgi:hypothetical protein